MKTADVTHWRGRRIEAMSRDELITALKSTCALNRRYLDELNSRVITIPSRPSLGRNALGPALVATAGGVGLVMAVVVLAGWLP